MTMTTRDLELIREQLTELRVVAGETNANVGHIAKHLGDIVTRQQEHSERINETAMEIARWKAMEVDEVAIKTAKTVADWKSKINLAVGVSTFVGIGGFLSMVALLIKEFSK